MSNATTSGAADPTSALTSSRQFPIVATLFASHFLTYLDRAVIATAIPFIANDFGLSSVAAGSVLSAFFFGYAVMQIPSGILVDRFGPARLLFIAVISWTFFTGMTGLVHSLAAMIAVRVLFGISEGPAPAAVSKAIAQSFPRDQVGRTNGVVLSATLLGSAAAPAFVAFIVLHWGWRAAFLSLLVPGVLLALAVHLVLGRSGRLAPKKNMAAEVSADDQAASTWGAVLGSSQMRWCIATVFIASCVNWGLQNWLPTYLLKARGFSIGEMGLMASAPYAAGALGYLLGGYAGDKLFAGRRNILVLLCLIASAVCTYAAAGAPSGGLAVVFMTGTFLTLGMGLSNLFTLPLVLVPVGAVGRAFGVVNTGAQIAGFLSPMLIGAVLDASNQNFALVLYLLVGLLLAAGIASSRIR